MGGGTTHLQGPHYSSSLSPRALPRAFLGVARVGGGGWVGSEGFTLQSEGSEGAPRGGAFTEHCPSCCSHVLKHLLSVSEFGRSIL